MKKSFLIFAFAMFLNLSFLFAQSCQLSPAHPQAGESITIKYDPTGTDLEGMEVYAVAYILENGEVPKAHDVAMAKSDSGYTGSFQTPASAQAVYVKFENADGDKVDKNNDEGYHTKMYKGDTPVKNAYAVSSTIYGDYAGLFGIKANGTKLAETLEKGIANPADRFSMDNLSHYAKAVRMNKDEVGKAKIVEHLNAALAKGKLSEKEMTKLADVARLLKNNDLQKSINDKIKSDFPKGKMAINGKYAGFRKLESLDDKLSMYKDAKSMVGDNKDHKRMLENMARGIAMAYGNDADFKNMYKYAEEISSKSGQAGIYNSVAWGCSGESLKGEGHDIKEGAAMSLKSLNLIEEEMNSASDKLDAYSPRQWKRNMKYTYAMYSDTYALLAYKNGDAATALKYQKVACETSDMGDATMNARYAVFMEKSKGAKEAMAFLENMIGVGKANSAMKEQFSRLFKANVSMDEASEMYMAKLEEKAKAKKIEEIKEEMMNKEAPTFALKNLKGEDVSLESLKGKVVVVDFWATWCGPCKASFPGMQKAVNKYEKTEDVAFVFIDTWESGEKKEENAKKFIDGKGYTFNVLMDNDNKMVGDYEVSGIPTKFILDKEGNIRFKSSGFNGNDDALVDEISIVVEILRGGEGASGSNAGAQP